MTLIRLKSSDGRIFAVDLKAVRQSVTIKTMLKDLGLDEEDEEEIIYLPEVTGGILQKVIEWVTHHKDDPPYIGIANLTTTDISDWDQQFMKVEPIVLFDLIQAAKYLKIESLVDTCCKAVYNIKKNNARRYTSDLLFPGTRRWK